MIRPARKEKWEKWEREHTRCDLCGFYDSKSNMKFRYGMHLCSTCWKDSTKCPKGHVVRKQVVAMDGCPQCEWEVWEAEAKKLHCPQCGKKETSKPTDADEGYVGYRSTCCGISYHILQELPDDPTLGLEPPET